MCGREVGKYVFDVPLTSIVLNSLRRLFSATKQLLPYHSSPPSSQPFLPPSLPPSLPRPKQQPHRLELIQKDGPFQGVGQGDNL